jgi:predicted nucleotidyltransferase/DNA-binding transcriptional ArsR family regulator
MSGDALQLLGLAPSAARILRYYVLRPHALPHARELQRLLRLGGSSLQRELARLGQLGALTRVEDGRRVRYQAAAGSPVWKAVRLLEGASTDPVPLVEGALVDVPGVRAAFVFGSTARGTHQADSDVDVFVIEGSNANPRRMLTQLSEAGLLLGREVNAVRYTPESLAERLSDASHPAFRFVRDALMGPKRWVAGDPAEVAAVAEAARIPFVGHAA